MSCSNVVINTTFIDELRQNLLEHNFKVGFYQDACERWIIVPFSECKETPSYSGARYICAGFTIQQQGMLSENLKVTDITEKATLVVDFSQDPPTVTKQPSSCTLL